MRNFLATTIIFAACGFSTTQAEENVRANFDKDIRPLLNQFCVRCHGPEEQNGRMRFDTLSTNLVKDRAAAADWHETLNVLNRGEMPPEDEPQPSVEQLKLLTGWMRTSIDDAINARRGTGGLTVMRRLNRTEYQNTMRDLLDFEMDYVRDLPPEGLSPDGFRNNGQSLRMTALQLEYYLEAARKEVYRRLDRLGAFVGDGEAFEQFAGAGDDAARKAGEFGDVNAVGLIRAPRRDAMEKHDLIAPFAHLHVQVAHALGGFVFERGEFVVVGGEECAGGGGKWEPLTRRRFAAPTSPGGRGGCSRFLMGAVRFRSGGGSRWSSPPLVPSRKAGRGGQALCNRPCQ